MATRLLARLDADHPILVYFLAAPVLLGRRRIRLALLPEKRAAALRKAALRTDPGQASSAGFAGDLLRRALAPSYQ